MIKTVVCVIASSFCLYNYVDKSNRLTFLKMQVPKIEAELRMLKEKNDLLRYEAESFEDPNRLMQLVSCPEYAHLKHPLIKDVLKLKEGIALQEKE